MQIKSRFSRVFHNRGGSIKRDADGVPIREAVFFDAEDIKEIEEQMLRSMYEDIDEAELERMVQERMAELDEAIKEALNQPPNS